MCRKVPAALLALVGLGAPLGAQSINLDWNSALGVPSNGFGAAAAQPGTWQTIPASVPFGPQPLLDINGQLTQVTLSVAPGPLGYNGLGNRAWNNPGTAGDLQALFDDALDVGGGTPFGFSGVQLSLNGLAADHYDVYVYAFAPDNYLAQNSAVTWNSVVAIQGTLPAQLYSGCVNWPGGMYAALNYTRHSLFVPAGVPLTINVDSDVLGGGFATLNGLQIKKGSAPCPSAASYCTDLPSSHACHPKLGAAGLPSLSNPAGFQVVGSNLESAQNGLLFFGNNGPNAAPFFGGVLCVKAPLYRLMIKNSGGSGNCSGQFGYALNDFLAQPDIGAQLVVGTLLHTQVWFRDPPAPQTVGLSNALLFTICP